MRDLADQRIDADQQRLTVTRGERQLVDRENAAGAGARVDDHRLPDLLRELVGEQPGDDVGRAAGRAGSDDAHGLLRPPGLRLRARHEDAAGAERRGGAEQAQREAAALSEWFGGHERVLV